MDGSEVVAAERSAMEGELIIMKTRVSELVRQLLLYDEQIPCDGNKNGGHHEGIRKSKMLANRTAGTRRILESKAMVCLKVLGDD